MDKELKAKWIAALRSGEFKQGREYFERYEKFCCLGVLCKVSGNPTTLEYHSNWDAVTPIIGNQDVIDMLWRMNDGRDDVNIRPHSFSEIADYIESHL